MIASLVLTTAISYLQPSDLPGCDFHPKPWCRMPDIPSLEWNTSDRRYVWPLEQNSPPFSRITYHRQPEKYGAIGTPQFGMTEFCLVDEELNTADCYSLWEYQTDAVCLVDRWAWISKPAALNGIFSREDPRWYHEHKGRVQLYLWEWEQRVNWFPWMGNPDTPVPRISFQADRTQTITGGDTILHFKHTHLFIKEPGKPTFKSGFDFNQGITATSPPSEFSQASCTASYTFFTNWCDIAPFRPECPRSAQAITTTSERRNAPPIYERR